MPAKERPDLPRLRTRCSVDPTALWQRTQLLRMLAVCLRYVDIVRAAGRGSGPLKTGLGRLRHLTTPNVEQANRPTGYAGLVATHQESLVPRLELHPSAERRAHCVACVPISGGLLVDSCGVGSDAIP